MTLTRFAYHSGATTPAVLASAMNNVQATMVIAESGTDYGWPTGLGFPFYLSVDYGLGIAETVVVTSKGALSGGNRTWNVVRGNDGTVSQAHASNATVRHVVSADELEIYDIHQGSIGDDSSIHSFMGRGIVAVSNRYTNANTPTNGAETACLWFVPSFTVEVGRLYRVSFTGTLSRSDSAAELIFVRFRLGVGTTSGTILNATRSKVLAASIVGDEFDTSQIFLGAASTALSVTTNVLPTVAAGSQSITLTIQKNSGAGNSATVGVNGVITCEDCGT